MGFIVDFNFTTTENGWRMLEERICKVNSTNFAGNEKEGNERGEEKEENDRRHTKICKFKLSTSVRLTDTVIILVAISCLIISLTHGLA